MRQFTLDPSFISISDTDVVRTQPGVSEEIGESEVTVVAAEGTTHVLNASAALIWLSLDGQSSVAQIVRDLNAETGVPADVLDRDVRETLARFIGSGIASVER